MLPRILPLLLLICYSWSGFSQGHHTKDIPKLENPITVEFLQKNLVEGHPRLVLNQEIESVLRKKLKTDPVIQNVYAAIKLNAQQIFDTPLLERKKVGRRLFGTSR